jgi:RNA polymerase sigma factor (sigma-70 family)
MDANRDAVYRLLVAMVGPVDADDCFQETFLSALRAYPALPRADNLRAWVLTIARRKAIDHVRAGKRQRAELLTEEEPAALLPEAAGEVWDQVRLLPPKQAAAIQLRFSADLDYADVGRLIGSNEAAARKSVSDGIRKLRENMNV